MRTCALAFIGVCLAAAVGSAQAGPVMPIIPPDKTPPTVPSPAGGGAVSVQATGGMTTVPVAGAEVPGVELSPDQQARVNALILGRNQALLDFDRAAESNVALLQVELAGAMTPRMAAQIRQKLDRIASQRQQLVGRTDLLVAAQVLTPQQRLQRNRAILASQAMLELEPIDLTAGQVQRLNRMVNLAAVQRGSYFDINADGRAMNPLAAQLIMSVLDPQQRLDLLILRPGGILSGPQPSPAAAASTSEVRADQARPRTQASSQTPTPQKVRRQSGGDAPASDAVSPDGSRRPSPAAPGQRHP